MEERYLDDWLDNPLYEETVCRNEFREIFEMIYRRWDDQWAPVDEDSPMVKVCQLIRQNLILLDGDAIYVRRNSDLFLINEAIDLLAAYMHVDMNTARKMADLVTSNFSGYFPVIDGHVLRDCIAVDFQDYRDTIDLSTLKPVTDEKFFGDRNINPRWHEYGAATLHEESFEALQEFFELVNQSLGSPYFAERMIMYSFHAPIREKSFVIKGDGGNGKSLMMSMLGKLYGRRAYIDAPQPKFSGHDAAVIAYSLVGKRVITFNDVDNPSTKFLEWLKRMITGNLEVKTASGAWLSVPCGATFYMETNHQPEFLGIEAHQRRFVYKEFCDGFHIADEMAPEKLDLIGDRSDLNAADITWYLMSVRDKVEDWSKLD